MQHFAAWHFGGRHFAQAQVRGSGGGVIEAVIEFFVGMIMDVGRLLRP